MQQTETRGGTAARPEPAVVAAIAAFVVYILIVGLEGTGRHFLELGVLRVVLFVALWSFARSSGARDRRLGKAALAVNGAMALGYVGGAIGAIATDGWSYDVFGPTAPAEPPWYAYIIGLTGILFALSTVLVGIAGRAAGRLAAVVVVAGASFPLAIVLGDTTGHVAWLVPWLVVAGALAGRHASRAT